MGGKSNGNFYGNAYIFFGIALLVTLAGFAPSYFLRLGETDTAHHFHGITATLWMTLLVTQPLCYRMGWMRIHRVIGRFSVLLVPLVVAGGLIMIHVMLNSGNYPGLLAEKLAFIDFSVLLQFVTFYTLALYHVRDTRLHARFMACTVFGPLFPALTRLFLMVPGIDTFGLALNLSYIVLGLVLILLIVDDSRRERVMLPYPVMFCILSLQQGLMNVVAEWSYWQDLMAGYAAIGG